MENKVTEPIRSYNMSGEDWDKLKSLSYKDFKPCPFCGEQKAALNMDTTRRRLFNKTADPNFPNFFFVECCNCFAQSGFELDPYKAIDKWNHRQTS